MDGKINGQALLNEFVHEGKAAFHRIEESQYNDEDYEHDIAKWLLQTRQQDIWTIENEIKVYRQRRAVLQKELDGLLKEGVDEIIRRHATEYRGLRHFETPNTRDDGWKQMHFFPQSLKELDEEVTSRASLVGTTGKQDTERN